MKTIKLAKVMAVVALLAVGGQASAQGFLKKLKKITQICLTYLTSLCYSKKCAIVDSYAMTAYEKQQKIRCF